MQMRLALSAGNHDLAFDPCRESRLNAMGYKSEAIEARRHVISPATVMHLF